MAAMRWWGWGEEGVSFTHEDKPALGPFLQRALDLDVTRVVSAPTALEELRVPEPSCPPELSAALLDAVGDGHVSTDPLDRVVHARGKSLRDLVRHRRGELGRLPDVVVRPADEEQVAAVIRAALGADAGLIPVGGGASISRRAAAAWRRAARLRPAGGAGAPAARAALAPGPSAARPAPPPGMAFVGVRRCA